MSAGYATLLSDAPSAIELRTKAAHKKESVERGLFTLARAALKAVDPLKGEVQLKGMSDTLKQALEAKGYRVSSVGDSPRHSVWQVRWLD